MAECADRSQREKGNICVFRPQRREERKGGGGWGRMEMNLQQDSTWSPSGYSLWSGSQHTPGHNHSTGGTESINSLALRKREREVVRERGEKKRKLN